MRDVKDIFVDMEKDNGWDKWKVYVLNMLKDIILKTESMGVSINERIDNINKRIDNLIYRLNSLEKENAIDIATLKVKSSVWGALGAVVMILLAGLIGLVFNFIKIGG